MSTSTHRHRPQQTTERGFTGPVTTETEGRYQQNPAAHGGIVVVDACRCGAVRRTNVNSQHVEYGRWEVPS